MATKKIPEIAELCVKVFRESENKAIAYRMMAEEVQKDLLGKLPKIKRLYWDYEPKSVEHMLFAMYPTMRVKYTIDAEYYEKRAADIEIPFRQEAEECMLTILHKKLFNIQCLWRAGQMSPAGADIVWDFHYWDENLYQCPFLPPITEEEIDLLIRFLKESPAELLDDGILHYQWQNYEHFKVQYAEEEEIELEEFYQNYILVAGMGGDTIPPWYNFYDTYMGTNGLLALPDIRYPKESYYRGVMMKHREEKKSEKQKAKDKRYLSKERKAWLGLDDYYKELTEMVEQFETPQNLKNFANYAKAEFSYDDENGLKEEVELALEYLWAAHEPVHMDECNDWREAIVRCYRNYRARKIIEAIPTVYEQYRMCIDNNIALPPNERTHGYTREWIDLQKKEILDARKLLGEPEDFDY